MLMMIIKITTMMIMITIMRMMTITMTIMMMITIRMIAWSPLCPLDVKVGLTKSKGHPGELILNTDVVHGEGARHSDTVSVRHGCREVTLAGLEPAIFGAEDQRLIH